MDWRPKYIVRKPSKSTTAPPVTPPAPPPMLFNGRLTRRGEVILDDGRKIRPEFGREWTPSRGPARQTVKADIDGRKFSGIVVGKETVRLLAVTNGRGANHATHEHV